ncbi:hypothetical protein [Nocardia sp. NPDC051750]|uniref:hypothetical protein n=1 Tax=Nocardia sp. NPDC051750 TaxID=3364325 RepID=UPI0037B87E07
MFSMLFLLVSMTESFEASGWWWLVLAALGFGAPLTLSHGAARQIGVALIVASSAVVIPYSVYPILAVLLFAVPIASICALVGGAPYLVWLRRHRRNSE